MADISKLDKAFEHTDARTAENRKNTQSQAPEIRKRSGCLGGVMYFVFILCVALILAVFGWMCSSDVLSLNKGNFETVITIPQDIFTEKTVTKYDDDNKPDGTETVSSADIDYVSAELKKAGLINYEWLFKLYCDISNADRKLDPGEYTLKSTYDYRALVQHMRDNDASLGTVVITIPEGYTMYQIFKKFEEEGVASYDDLMDAAANSNFKYSFLDNGVEGATRLEGFLFPDTYEFYMGMEASSAINKMLQTFSYKKTADMDKQADNLGYSFYAVLKVASIVEKEAYYDEDRAKVASVIYNRLRSDWQIGMDSTILYLYPEHEGEPNAEMLAEDTPYNSRLHRGLPPTPICNPGMASINAALNPEQTSYYYFMSDDEGRMHFFGSEGEFNAYRNSLNG